MSFSTVITLKGKEGDLVGDRYELRADVGLGTFGRVVECWDTKRCRRVAVKIVRKVFFAFYVTFIQDNFLEPK